MIIVKRLYHYLKQEYAFALAIPALLWQIIFLYIPLIFVIGKALYAGNNAISGTWLLCVCDWVHARIIFRSLEMSVMVASVCLLIAYPVAYYLALRIQRGKNIFLFLLTLPFWTNFLVQIYAWVFIVEQHGIINTLLLHLHIIKEPIHILHTKFIIGLVMVYSYLPFMIIPLFLVLEKFDKRLLEAAADLGATRLQALFRVTVPLTLAGMRTGFLLVMVPVFGDYAICTVLGGGKYLFVGPLIAEYFLVAHDMTTGAAFLLISLLILLAAMGIISIGIKALERKWV